MIELVEFTVKLIVLLLVLSVVFVVLGLCKAASERDRSEAGEEKRSPKCYKPNDDPYPLCVGNGSPDCLYCCLYEDMPEPPFD